MKLKIGSGSNSYEVSVDEEGGIFEIPSDRAGEWLFSEQFFTESAPSRRYKRYTCSKSTPRSCIESAEFIIQTIQGRNPPNWAESQDATPPVYAHWGNGTINITEDDSVQHSLTGKTPYPFAQNASGDYTQLTLGTGLMIGNITKKDESPYNMHLGAIVAYQTQFKGFIISDVSEEGSVKLIKPWRIFGINKPDDFRGTLYQNKSIYAIGLLDTNR